MAPAMNVRMWQHAATQRNVAQLARPTASPCSSPTRARWPAANMAPAGWPSPQAIFAAITAALGGGRPLAGKHVLVTAGPTHEPIDPVRLIANRSSGKQGFAIAAAARRRWARG